MLFLFMFATIMVGQAVEGYPSPDVQISIDRLDSAIVFRDEPTLGSMDEFTNSSDTTTDTTPGYKLYTRADWDAKTATDKRPLTTPTPYVVIHHTYIPAACYATEKCFLAMKSMQNYHMSMDWGDIGYNFCVGSEGGVYEGRGWDVIGIHAGSANSVSIGICLIGDWRTELPPSEQIEATKALIADGVKRGIISPEYKLIGHRQAMSTECPGGALYNIIKTWDHYSPKFTPLIKKTV